MAKHIAMPEWEHRESDFVLSRQNSREYSRQSRSQTANAASLDTSSDVSSDQTASISGWMS